MRRRTGSIGDPGSRLGAGGTPRAGLALKLHQAPDLSAVGTEVRLDVDGHLGSTRLEEAQRQLEQGLVERAGDEQAQGNDVLVDLQVDRHPNGQIGDGRKLAVQRLDKAAQTKVALGARQRRAGRPPEQLLD
jgi:hypothetical protein